MLSWMPSAVPGGFAVVREMEKQRFIMSVQTCMGVHTPCEHILLNSKTIQDSWCSVIIQASYFIALMSQ